MSRLIHKISTLDTSLFEHIKTKSLAMTEDDWNIHTQRKITYEMHSKTDTIPLTWGARGGHYATINDLFRNDLETIRKIFAEEYGSPKCFFFNVFLVRMQANTVIPVHVDSLDMETQGLGGLLRCHIPIVTHPDVLFTVGNETKHLEEGTLYSIDNFLTPHGVENNSDVDRIHMILDVRLM